MSKLYTSCTIVFKNNESNKFLVLTSCVAQNKEEAIGMACTWVTENYPDFQIIGSPLVDDISDMALEYAASEHKLQELKGVEDE